MKIDKRILGLCDIASKEVSRKKLSCIRFEKGKAIATDGYCLMTIEQPAIENGDVPKVAGFDYTEVDNVHLPAMEIKKLAKEIKKSKHVPVLNTAWSVRQEENRITLATTDVNTTTLKELRQPDDEYPDYQKIIDKELANKPLVEIAFSPRLMRGLLEAMVKAGATQWDSVEMRISGEQNPIIIKGKDNAGRQIFSLLMPVRRA